MVAGGLVLVLLLLLLLFTCGGDTVGLLLFVPVTNFSYASFGGKPLKLSCLARSVVPLLPASLDSAFTNGTKETPAANHLCLMNLAAQQENVAQPNVVTALEKQ